jgi:Arc/MetJ-type ribon-helix-helix transcriptional regulator
MNTTLTPEQEKFIQVKLQTGKYRNAQELLELAFKLLDESEITLLSESCLEKDWLKPEEDEAWQDL